jgi:cytochrome P450
MLASKVCALFLPTAEHEPNQSHQTENLRLHPIASELGRRTLQEPANLSGVEVPPYTVVSASYRALHQ